MKYKILLPFFFLGLLFSSSCSKNDTVNGQYPKQNNRSEIPTSISPVPIQSDAVLNQNLVASVQAVPSLNLNALYSLDHNGPAYSQILTSSIAILEQAKILDNLKASLGIITNDDPKIIIAALLINNIYNIPRPIVEGSIGSSILKCALTALGLPMGAMARLVGALTMAEIGTALSAFGFRWFAGAVLKTGLKAASGAGLTIMVAQFTFCMIWESENPTPGQLESYAPPETGNPNTPIYNYTFTEFNNYINVVKSWILSQHEVPYPSTLNATELKNFIRIFNINQTHPVHSYQNDTRFQGQLTTYVDKEYFKSGGQGPTPTPN